ncbi:MAG: hypothetical protein M1469_04755 [Bacteroidetes bacterium]|nr:hypothetical protein [Bacteroidota bacterium]
MVTGSVFEAVREPFPPLQVIGVDKAAPFLGRILRKIGTAHGRAYTDFTKYSHASSMFLGYAP